MDTDDAQQFKLRIESIQNRIDSACRRAGRPTDAVTLIAASKTVPAERLILAHSLGLHHFGENRLQEALPKVEALTRQGIRPAWHFIGVLQSNKAKVIAEHFDIIHSVDSLRLAQLIGKNQASPVSIMIEVNVGGEVSKSGVRLDDDGRALDELVGSIRAATNIELIGLMTIAPPESDPEKVRPYFRRMATLAQEHGLPHLSMGMSDDFEVAIEEGATMVRIGRALFGDRS